MHRLLASVGVAAVLALAGPAMAQTAAPAAAGPVTLIQAGRLLDRPGQAPRGPSTVVVRDGLIVEIRDGFIDAAAFPGSTVIDQRDRFVLPGLIDSHVHLGTSQAGQAGLIARFTESVATTAYRAAENARVTLMAGHHGQKPGRRRRSDARPA